MKNEHESIANQINNFIQKNQWFDFHLWSYDGRNLVIVGSTDLTMYHKLEIIFTDVFFASTFFEIWHSDTSNPILEIPDPELNIKLNVKFEVEQGYQVFIIKTENYNNDIYIVSKEIGFNTNTVYYYWRENLKEDEKLASFVKKNS